MTSCRFHQAPDPTALTVPETAAGGFGSGLCLAVPDRPRVPTTEEAALCGERFESCIHYGHALRDRLRAIAIRGIERGLPTLPRSSGPEGAERDELPLPPSRSVPRS